MKKSIFISVLVGMLMASNLKVNGQADALTHNRNPAYYLGWTGGTPGPLEIRNDHNDVINFSTNTNPQAVLDANGNFSIGWTYATNYFGIYNGSSVDPILWHNGNIQDIFVGVGAGNNTMTGHANTYYKKPIDV